MLKKAANNKLTALAVTVINASGKPGAVQIRYGFERRSKAASNCNGKMAGNAS